jgi:hypothetical protein
VALMFGFKHFNLFENTNFDSQKERELFIIHDCDT